MLMIPVLVMALVTTQGSWVGARGFGCCKYGGYCVGNTMWVNSFCVFYGSGGGYPLV